LTLNSQIAYSATVFDCAPALYRERDEPMISDEPCRREEAKHAASLRLDGILWVSVFLFLFAMAAKSNYPDPTYRNQKFAYEYGNIAEAVVNGKGFANPFPLETGPTAWMPPFYVYLMAVVFKVCGAKSLLSLWVLMAVKFLGMSASLCLLLRAADQGGCGNSRYWMVPLFLVYIFAYGWQFFSELHDIWLTQLLTCWLVYGLTSLATSSFRRGRMSLLLLSFILPLANPALGLSLLFILLAWILIEWLDGKGKKGKEPLGAGRRAQRRQSRILLAALAIFACSICIWSTRNYVVFGRLIPVKSNFWFDLYQANYHVSNGVVSCSTFMNYHPINLAPETMRHFAGGEQAFAEHFRRASIADLRKDPGRMLRGFLSRAKNAFLLGDVYLDVVMVEKGRLVASDVERLNGSSLVFRDPVSGSVHWTSLGLSKDDFYSVAGQLNLADVDRVVEGWEEAKGRYVASRTAKRTMVKRLLCTGVATLSILCCMLFREVRESSVFILSFAIYSTYLLPYIVVSHYSRYQLGLVGLIVLFLFLSLRGVHARAFGGDPSIAFRFRERLP